jgi:hypothetical protein
MFASQTNVLFETTDQIEFQFLVGKKFIRFRMSFAIQLLASTSNTKFHQNVGKSVEDEKC